MKRLFFIWTIVLCSILGTSAQTLFYEGFEDGVLPAGWTVIDADGDGYNWYELADAIGPVSHHSGTGHITSASWVNEEVLTPDGSNSCADDDKCPLAMSLTRTAYSNNNTYTVDVYVDDYPYATLALDPSQERLDTILLFCSGRRVNIWTSNGGEDFAGTITDPFGKVTESSSWGVNYYTQDVCAQQCELVLEIGADYIPSNGEWDSWVELYAGDDIYPFNSFSHDGWWSGSETINIPVSAGVPLRVVWHEPDANNHSGWFTLYDPSQQRMVATKESYDNVADGEIATYTPDCGASCECPLAVSLTRTAYSNDNTYMVEVYVDDYPYATLALDPSQERLDTILLFCSGRRVNIWTSNGGEDFAGTITDPFGKVTESSSWGVNYYTQDVCAQQCELVLEIGANYIPSNGEWNSWLEIYAGENTYPFYGFSQYGWWGGSETVNIPVSAGVPLRVVWHEPDADNHSSWFTLYDPSQQRMVATKESYDNVADGEITTYTPDCGASCECPLAVSLTRTAYSNDNTYTVEVYVDDYPYATLALAPSQQQLDTTLLFCSGRRVDILTSNGGEDFAGTVTDSHGAVTEVSNYFTYYNEDVCTDTIEEVIPDSIQIVYVTPSGSGIRTGESWENAMSSIAEAQELAEIHHAVVWVAAGIYYGDTLTINAFTMVEGVSVYGGFAGNEPADYDLSQRDYESNTTILDGQNVRRVLYRPDDLNQAQTTWDGFTIQNGNGGVRLDKNCVLNNCVIRNNRGYGIYVASRSAIVLGDVVVSNCIITYNSSTAIRSISGKTLVANCLVANNSEGLNGHFNVENTSILNNAGWGVDNGYNNVILNSIIWGNSIASIPSNLSNNIICTYSAIEGGYEGEGNISLDDVCNRPMFVNPSLTPGAADSTSNVDWHLQSGSVCINRGNNNAVTDSVDLSGIARIQRDTVDMGCYESNYYSNTTNTLPIVTTLQISDTTATSAVCGGTVTMGCGDSIITRGVCWSTEPNPTINDQSTVDGTGVGSFTSSLNGLTGGTTYYIRAYATNSVGTSYGEEVVFTTLMDYQGIIYVTQTGAGDHSGNSWANATSSIDTAQILAQEHHAVVWVAAGTYYGDTTATNAFTMRDGVSVYGGFAGNEPSNYDLSQRDFEANETILDGQNARRVLYQPSNFSAQTAWDGFTVQHGNATGSGGGVYLRSNGCLSHCKVQNNTSSSSGGGLYASGSTVSNCQISNNTSSSSGGGVYGYNSTVSSCQISNNSSSSYGGGVYASGSGSTVRSSTIVRNSSGNNGGGVYRGTLTNCIVWGNERNGVADNVYNVICTYSAIKGGYSGTGNVLLSGNEPFLPMFVNPSLTAGAYDTTPNVDWHLQNGSVCVNRGDNSAVTDSLDLDGTARIKRDTVDMGCYESDYYSVPVAEYDSIIYVTVTGAGSRSGLDWANATSSIEAAQALAQMYGAMVWVAAGTYYGDTTATSENAFTMREGVNVYGGFAGNEPADYDLSQRDFEANATILDGLNARRVLYQPSNFSSQTVWDGFTVQHGNTTGNGGGVYLRSNGCLSHCKVQNNTTTGSSSYGGGVYARSSTVSNCQISNNTTTGSSSYGGGVYAYDNSTISNCQISNNTTTGSSSDGGGVYASDNTTVSNCQISNNTSSSAGGGVYAEYNTTVSNCQISNNTATGSYSYGGGVYAYSNSTVRSSTIVRNSSWYNGGGVYRGTLTNCIVWGNERNGVADNVYDVICSYSAIEGGYSGTGNVLLSGNEPFLPMFVTPSLTAGASDSTSNVDWHLLPGSLCINRGDNTAVTYSLDLDGNARIQRDTVDLGCYESDYYNTEAPSYAGIIYVTPTGSGKHSGDNWENAISSIEEAQALAQTYGAMVWVASGTYYGDTLSENAFTMRDSVSVYGGFAGDEPADYDLSQRDFEANATILDGLNARRVLYQPSNFSAQTAWDGFTVQHGNTTGDGGGVYLRSNGCLSHCKVQNNTTTGFYSAGGGVFAEYNTTVSNCQISNNTTTGSSSHGGGVYASDNTTVSNCLISNNVTSSYGGGVGAYNSTVINCQISNNVSSSYGGGVYAYYNSTVNNCQISNNTSSSYGGGVYAEYNTTVSNCQISNNTSSSYGGGVYAYYNSTISNCQIGNNSTTGSSSYGGGVYARSSTVSNCQISNNTTTGSYSYGGGVYAEYNTTVSNCQISNNTTTGSYSYGGGMYAYYNSTISNCQIGNNTTTGSYSYGGGVYAYSNSTVSSCQISNNTSSSSGGGVCANNSTVRSSTIVRNSSGNNGGGVYSGTLTNCIVWGNEQNGTANNVYNAICSHSAIEGGYAGDGNVFLSDHAPFLPLFVNPSLIAGAGDTTTNVDWHLLPGSLCINRGDNSAVTDSLDLDGNARIQRDTVDLGCYESDFYSLPLPEYAGIVYVTVTGAGSRSGLDWANATSSIEEAQALAQTYGAMVWVAAGTYYGDTTATSENAFTMREGVNVYGGFAGNEPSNYDLSQRNFEANATILDGQNARRVLYQPNSFTAATAVTWDGFTIQNGRVDGDGAGVYMRDYSSLQHCCVQYNAAFSNVSAYRYGGGVYVTSSNSSSVQIAYCKIAYNVVEGTNNGYAGGIYTTYAKVRYTEISHNSSTYRGGGVYAYYNCTYSNCLIHNNTSPSGGGIYNYSSNNTYVNCDIINNSGRGIYCYNSSNFTNCIVWGNKVNHMVNNVYGGSYSYCAVEEGASGTNNITLASTNDGNDASQYYVRFNDPENEDFRLHPTSSCVNVGNNAVVTDAVDFYGDGRIYNDVVDVGCSEAQNDSECPSVVNLNVSNTTAHSALLTWHPTGNESQWAVVYNEVGATQTTVVTNDTAFALTGLSLNRNYTAKVRAICDSGMMSIFSIPVNFQTDCDPTVLDTLSNFTTLMPENGTVVYANRVSFTWSLLPEATSYDFYLWTVGATEPTTPSVSGLTMPTVSNYALPNYQPGKEYYWKVVAWNECLNKQSEVQTIRVNKYPDLHVSQVVTSNPVAGQLLTVTWTVTNDGEGNTPPGQTWNDYIWISPVDGVGGGFWYNVSEVLLATIPNLTSLNSSESYQNSVAVTVPEDFMGNYYLFVFADQHDVRDIDYSPTGQTTAPDPYTPSADGNPYHYLSGTVFHSTNQMQELPGHEADNFFYKVVSVLPPPSPDLVVSSIAHPANTFSGNQVPLTWTITNQGEAAAVGSWYDAVYISEDTVLNTATDLRLGRFLHQGTLLIDSSYARTEQVTIPIDYMGDYYFFVMTDCMETVYEGLYEQNNIGISSHPLAVMLTPPADLTVTSIILPDILDANAQYQCSYSVKNVGASNTYGNSWTDVLYLSKDSVFVRDSARRVGSRYHSGVLSPDSSYHSLMSFTVPKDISGLWYMYVSTDDGNQIFEYNLEDNNVVKRMPAVMVNIPDLTVSNIVVADTVDPNSATRVRWTIRNNGPGNVVNRTFRDCFVYDGQQIYSVAMYNINLAAGDSISRSAMVQIPCSGLEPSALTIITDFEQLVQEMNENNNSSTKQLNVLTPNLVVTSVTTPDTVWSGTLLSEAAFSQDSPTGVSYKIRNDGDLPVIDKVVTDRIYLSASADSYQESDSLVSYTHTITLAPNSTQTFTCQVPIPNGISGNYYFHVACNVDNAICEAENISDNVGHSDVTTVNLSPWADLVLTQVYVQDTTFIGANFPVSYTIRNNGTAPLNHVSVCQKFYYSTSPTYYNVNDLLSVKNDNLYLAVGAEVTNVAYMALPTTQLQRYYYIHVVTDATDLVYEHTGENNNNAVSNSFFARYYQLDLAAIEIDGPTEVQWGQTATYRMHVNNNSSLPTLVSQWQDALYLSNDPVLNSADVLQQMVNHGAVLEAGGDYWTYFNVTIPFGTPATAYLLGYADFNNNNPDINYSNNSTVKAITVNSVPTPDLAVTEMMVLDDVISGQPARLVYTVENVGELDVSTQTWNDKLFLSFDTVYQSADIELQTNQRPNMTMAVGDSYTDTITFTVPLPYNGGLNLLAVANFTNQPYEVTRDNNMRSESVTVILPPPGDLIVTGVTSDDSVVSGSMLHASWDIRNIGDNPLTGNGLRTLVYVSKDTAFDANDRLLGNLTASLALGVDEVMTQNVDIRISGLAEGEYYLIVKTDVTNAFNEVNENNNSGYSAVPFVLTVRPLPFDTDVPDVLRNNEVSDFKLTVGDYVGQTVRIHLSSEDSLAGAVNMIYATHNGMGDNLNYTYSTIGQFTANPELYIPSTWPGYYGVNIYGSTPVGNEQNTVVRADILPFELRAIDANYGGNTGKVTVELTGSHFRPDMKVSLQNSTDTITPDTLIYVNYYQAFATFDLKNRTPGFYDVVAVNFCEGEAILQDGFEIQNASPDGLSYNLIFPNSPRPNRNIVMMLEFGNTGNVDLHNQVLEITSVGGIPISLTPEGISLHQTTILVPLLIEGEPQGLLRPGSYGTVNIYGYTSSGLVFSIKPIEE